MPVHSYPGLRGVVAVGLVAILATACSGAATSNSTATAVASPANTTSVNGPSRAGTADPCALVTAAEAQATMGLPVATTTNRIRASLTCANTRAPTLTTGYDHPRAQQPGQD